VDLRNKPRLRSFTDQRVAEIVQCGGYLLDSQAEAPAPLVFAQSETCDRPRALGLAIVPDVWRHPLTSAPLLCLTPQGRGIGHAAAAQDNRLIVPLEHTFRTVQEVQGETWFASR
jgi:hypothetical protein